MRQLGVTHILSATACGSLKVTFTKKLYQNISSYVQQIELVIILCCYKTYENTLNISFTFLKEELPPGHLVILDSFIDRTTKRVSTFHDQNR